MCFLLKPWTVRGILLEHFPQSLSFSPQCNKTARLSQLIEGKELSILDYIRTQINDIMEHIKEYEIEGEDEWVWTPTITGEYTMKDTYEAIRTMKEPVFWPGIAWYAQRIPRHSFISGLALSNCLKTLMKMEQWGVVQSSRCVLCWKGREDEKHLFFKCQFYRSVWKELLRKAVYGRVLKQICNENLLWVRTATRGKGLRQIALKLLFNTYLWHLDGRNNQIFNNKQPNHDRLVENAFQQVNMKLAKLKMATTCSADRTELQ